MSDDWRLTDQEDFLTGITLVRVPYEQWSQSWDHDHCAFCWAKFAPAHVASPPGEPFEREGYTNVDVPDTPDHYWWICAGCFEDFEVRFRWTVQPASAT